MKPIYDSIGKTYTDTRAADPRISQRLIELLSLPAKSRLIDIGAGSGNYSTQLAEAGMQITAVEPSAVMRAQAQQHDRLTWCEGFAESLPFGDGQFDGAVMTLSMHHFTDWKIGLTEAMRVSDGGPLVMFSFDIEHKANFWLFDYFPKFVEIDQNWSASLANIENFLRDSLDASMETYPFPLPRDLIDHFAAAGWARPEIYLQEKYRKGISSFSKLTQEELEVGLSALRGDLEDGSWHRKYGELLKEEFYDRGYLFIKIKS